MQIKLPFPPSLNHYYRQWGGRTLISRAGLAYRRRIAAEVFAHNGALMQPMAGPLAVTLELFPPDRKRRDVDNYCKCLLDALAKAGVYQDDSQIVELHIFKREVVGGGKIVVNIATPVEP